MSEITDVKKSKNNLRRQNKSNIFTVIMQLVLIFISGLMVYNIVRTLDQAAKKNQILIEAEKQVEELRIENIKLVLKSNNVTTDDFVELQARNRLNYSRDGEVQYVIPDSLLEEYGNRYNELMYEKEADQDLNNLELWFDFLKKGI